MLREPWRNPAHLSRCEGKHAFRSLARAEIEAERASRKTGELILAYTCCDCGSAHVGHADLSQQFARVEHVDQGCKHCGQPIPESKKRKAFFYASKALYCSDRCQSEARRERDKARRAGLLATPHEMPEAPPRG